ncbi:MAG: TfuA-like protein [Gammaproteobacteria bacterium]|nr:TfuA-like protein [Gammaproteobacteria bacterium]MDH3411428.1 TfuA-like protein [Gammaproteobacteria bacterium]
MTACVFIGPTLPVAQAREVLDAEYLPPVRQGDVYRAVMRFGPQAVGIIDGYFHQVPSVWHKEILWAMAEGVHVFGSASMGALRAAELQPFGMHGVGEVFAGYRQRIIEDDDEVAVVHGPPETGFLAASEAMVNIRCTLTNAEGEGVIAAETRRALVSIAKALFYPRRSYSKVLERGAAEGLPAGELSALHGWLGHGRVDVKRNDALEMLSAMGELLERDPTPKRVDYRFEHTSMWQAAITEIDATLSQFSDDADLYAREWLLDELRLDGDAYQKLKPAALLRMLALREAERNHIEVSDQELSKFTTNFRLDHGLHFGRDLDQWLSERNLDRKSLEKLMAHELLVNKLAGENAAELERNLIDLLRLNGDFAKLAARARAKRNALTTGERAQKEQVDLDDLRAMTWYFSQRLGRPMPEDIDAWAVSSGFEGAAAFRRAVLREYRYQLSGKRE